MESRYIHRSHNVSVLMHHLVCASKYRRVVMSEPVDEVLKEVCLEIEPRYEIWFLEIGVDRDPAHFLVQSVPMYRATRIVQTVKGLTAREVFAKAPEVKRNLWGGEFWGKGCFVNTVGQHGSEKVIAGHVNRRGEAGDYRQLHKGQTEFRFCNASHLAARIFTWRCGGTSDRLPINPGLLGFAERDPPQIDHRIVGEPSFAWLATEPNR